MVRRSLLLLTWLLGTAVSILTGTLGVRLVTTAVTEHRVSPLTEPDVIASLAVETASSELAGSAAQPADPGAAPPEVAGTSTTEAPAPPGKGPARPAPVAVPAPASPSDQRSPAAVRPPSGGEPRVATQIIQSRGGAVAVRHGSGRTELVWARPNLGFEVHVVEGGPQRLSVEFRGDDKHRSRIRAWLGDAGPEQDVQEWPLKEDRGRERA
jgi:hypothetical protein